MLERNFVAVVVADRSCQLNDFLVNSQDGLEFCSNISWKYN